MKGRIERLLLISTGALLAILVGIWGWTMVADERDVKTYSVSFLAVSENERMQRGVEQAAIDYNIDLHMITGYKSGDAQKQMEYLARELGGGTDGAIIAPEDTQVLEEFLRGTRLAAPVLTLGGAVDETLAGYVGIDNQGAGALLAARVLDETEGAITLIMPAVPDTAVMQRRDGFVEAARAEGRAVAIFSVADEAALYEKINERAETVFVFLEESLVLAACRSEHRELILYACGFEASLRDGLESGRIRALVVWSEYDIGYLALAQIAARIAGEPLLSTEIALYLATAETMYDPPLAQILFPIG